MTAVFQSEHGFFFITYCGKRHILLIGRLKYMAKANDGCIIYLPSETYAISAERLLGLKGIDGARVKETDRKKGCVHGIRVDCRKLDTARHILITHSYPVS